MSTSDETTACEARVAELRHNLADVMDRFADIQQPRSKPWKNREFFSGIESGFRQAAIILRLTTLTIEDLDEARLNVGPANSEVNR